MLRPLSSSDPIPRSSLKILFQVSPVPSRAPLSLGWSLSLEFNSRIFPHRIKRFVDPIEAMILAPQAFGNRIWSSRGKYQHIIGIGGICILPMRLGNQMDLLNCVRRQFTISVARTRGSVDHIHRMCLQ
jgi:hypothetical protein